jgi:hypothetical protein
MHRARPGPAVVTQSEIATNDTFEESDRLRLDELRSAPVVVAPAVAAVAEGGGAASGERTTPGTSSMQFPSRSSSSSTICSGKNERAS